MLSTEAIRGTLIENLNRLGSDPKISKLNKLVLATEEMLQAFSRNFLYSLATSTKFDHQLRISNDLIFFSNNHKYSLNVSGSKFIPHRLELLINSISKEVNDNDFYEYSSSLTTKGQYSEYFLRVPKNLDIDVCKTLESILEIFKSGYVWLVEVFRNWIRTTETEMEIALISILRRNLSLDCKLEHFNKVWLVLTNDRNITYAIDSSNYEDFFEANKLQSYGGMSSNYLISTLFEDYIPFDKSFSKEAWKNSQSIAIDIRKAKYQEEHTKMQLAQEAIYDRNMILHPLVERKKMTLLAVYPSINENDISEILQNSRLEFDNVMENKEAKFFKDWKKMNSKKEKMNYNDIAEMAGSFTRGLLDL